MFSSETQKVTKVRRGCVEGADLILSSQSHLPEKERKLNRLWQKIFVSISHTSRVWVVCVEERLADQETSRRVASWLKTVSLGRHKREIKLHADKLPA